MTILKRVSTACGAALLVCGLVACSGAKPQTEAEIPQLAFEKYALPNGLEVILSEDHRLPLVAVDIWYHVGPANEAAGRTGFAHLFEHMMFQGSKHVPGDSHFQMLEAAGGSNLNGTTDFDRTNYFETLPANQLELGLWLESDRMGYLLDTVDELKLANQQMVVRNERRQNIEGVPYGIFRDVLFQNLYPKGHPYFANVMGSHADIQAAKLADVKDFFKQYYAPNNASLTLAGDFDKAQAKQLVEKYFGALKRGPDVPKVTVTTPAITAERRVVVKDHIQLPRVQMAWITPPFFKPGDADADILGNILGGNKSSRLYKTLVYDKQIAQDVQAFQASTALGSTFQIVATARPKHTVEELEAAIDAELEKLRQNGVDQPEIDRARNTFETGLLTGLEVLGGFGGVADTLNLFNHYVKDPGYLATYIKEHRAVSPGSVKAFAQAYLKTNARVVLHGVPGDPDLGPAVPTPPPPKVAPNTGSEAVNADEAWRKDKPAAAASRPIQLPTAATFKLANGLTVIYHQRTGMPVVAAEVVIGTGGDSNPIDKPGLANFTAAMLDQGTATRDAPKIADALAQIGTSLSATSSKDATMISIQALRPNLAAALDLLADVTLHPAFPAAEVDRQRSSRMAGLIQQRQDPSSLATIMALASLYGPKHPYGFTELGSEASVRTAGREDMVGFWKQNFVPGNAALIVAGSISEADLKPLVEKAFGSWPGGAQPTPRLGAWETTPAKVVIVDKPGSPQTQILVATIGAQRSSPDYAATSVMNAVLGGLFSSRVNLNLREKHGYTYGAYSQFIFRKGQGPFWVSAPVETGATAPAITEIFNELKKMSATPILADEMTMAKDALVRSLPAAFETSASTVGTMADLYIYSLGLDYYSKYPGEITAVTPAAAQAAAGRYLDPAKMIVIAVGDRKKIEAGLAKLNLGKIEIRNADGTVAK